jgi:hypothetical protein
MTFPYPSALKSDKATYICHYHHKIIEHLTGAALSSERKVYTYIMVTIMSGLVCIVLVAQTISLDDRSEA